MSRTAIGWCCVLLPLSLLPAAVVAQEPDSAEPDAAPRFKTPASLVEALDLALAAVREAEKQGAGAREKLEEAKHYTQMVYGKDPTNAKAHFVSARINILIGRSRDAFSQINTYVQTADGRNDWEAFKILGNLHFEGGYYVQAEAKYKRASSLNPDEAPIYVGLCKCAIKRGQRRDAEKWGKQATEKDGGSPEAHEVYAQALLRNSKFDEAKQAIEAAVRVTKDRLRTNPGDTALLTKLNARYQLLEGILQAIIKRDPDLAEPYWQYARSVLAQVEVQRMFSINKALKKLDEGITATAPNTPAGMIFEYADLLASVGRYEEAVTVLQEFLEADPTNTTAQDKLNDIQAAKAAADAAND
ncbi:MAG: tetratricopeptide repeat protein [Planctomycetota bacterium]|jgi:tetratricopeptide (TPR) repeat protein